MSDIPDKDYNGGWWLAPFFFGIIGGIVAYLCVKDDNRRAASHMLAFGIVWGMIAGIIIFIVATASVASLGNR